MHGKKRIIGIIALILSMAFAFMLVTAPINAYNERITFDDYYSKSALSAIALFLCSALASCCFFNKIGRKTLHSTASAVIIGVFGVSIASVVTFILGRNITDSIVNRDMTGIIKNAVISAVSTPIGGFVAGFGMTAFDFSKRTFKNKTSHTAEQTKSSNASVSKTASAILAFFLGGLGIHRYYLGYKKQGAIQTCGFISLVIPYSYYLANFIYGRVADLAGTILTLLLALFGSATSIWAFVDFIRILTGGLQPANGNTYAENGPQQVRIVQHNETASDTADAIAKLAKLHEQGILTDEEFQKKKAELLAKM